MTTTYLNRIQSRKVDEIAIQQFGMAGIVLMENAGFGCAKILLQRSPTSVVILSGAGNNGGDGFVVARHLSNAGVKVKIVSLVERETIGGDAQHNLEVALKMNLPFIEVSQGPKLDSEIFRNVDGKDTDWIVDAMLGTGAHGPLRSPFDQAVQVANEMPVSRLAIDIPTGLDCDSGEPGPICFRADATCTMVAHKVGFKNERAVPFLGTVTVVDIGMPKRILAQLASNSED